LRYYVDQKIKNRDAKRQARNYALNLDPLKDAPLLDQNKHRISSNLYKWVGKRHYKTRSSILLNREQILFPNPLDPDIMNKMPIITNGIESKYIGKFPAKVGTRPQKFKYTSNSLKLLYKLKGEEYNLPNPENFALVGGSWDTNRGYVQLISNSSNNSPKFSLKSYYKYLPTLQRYLSKLQITTLPTPKIEDIYNVEFSPDTNPGPRWDYLLGMKTKGAAAHAALPLCKKLYSNIMKGEWRSESLYSIGGREVRKDDLDEEDKVIDSRGILMPEMHEFLLESIYSRPIETLFTLRESGPLYLGSSFKHAGFSRFQRDLAFSNSILEGDWKKYDTSVSNELIILGIAIMRAFYEDSQRIDRVFLHFVSNLVYKRIITPGGFIYEFSSSVPSGSCFTSILNSIINFLILSKMCDENLKIINPSNVRFAIGGDDFLIFLKYSLDDLKRITKDDFVTTMFNETGMMLKNFSVSEPFPKNINDCASFYKTILWNGVPTIRPDHLFEVIYTPNSMIKNSWELLPFLDAFFEQGPSVFSHFCWIFDLYFIELSYRDKININEYADTYKRIFKALSSISININQNVTLNEDWGKFVLKKRDAKSISALFAAKTLTRKKSIKRAYAVFGHLDPKIYVSIGVKN